MQRPASQSHAVADILLDPGAEAAVPVYCVDEAELDEALGRLDATQRAWAGNLGFKAKAGESALLPDGEGRLAKVLFGLGRADGNRRTPFLAGALANSLPEGVYAFAEAPADADLAALAWCLSAYRFDRYRKAARPNARLVAPDGVDAAEIRRIASGTALARDLVNVPASDMGPAELAEAAGDIAARHGARITVTQDEALERDFPMIHAVGRASTRAPRLIDMVWGDEAAPKVTLVGKGVCYDTGGLDIKPSKAMALMKKDMGGSAAVLGLADMIMAAGLRLRLRVLVPAVENSIAGNAFRTGDVLRSRKGLSVEIGNTDAEGRLVLADALALADEEEPDLVIDMATLTGAARVALGTDIAPFFTADETLAAALSEAAAASFDPLWRLPLWPGYRALIESKIADINHVSSAPFAGSITAALFLQRFVEKAKAWAHFDIYAWNPSTRPGRPEGGEGTAIRALYRVLKARYG